MVFFLKRSVQTVVEAIFYLNSSNILLLVNCFYSRTKCIFVLGVGGCEIPNKVYLGEIDGMVR